MAKKTTVNLATDNYKKIQELSKMTGLTQSELINQSIAEIPVIVLGDQASLAESFFELRRLIATNNSTEIGKEIEHLCQSLNLLMAKINALMQSKKG